MGWEQGTGNSGLEQLTGIGIPDGGASRIVCAAFAAFRTVDSLAGSKETVMGERATRSRSVRRGGLIGAAIAACIAGTAIYTAGEGLAASHWARITGPDSALLQRMFDVEDARATDSASFATLNEGLRSADAETRRIAARAFGRMERAAGLGAVRSVLDDPSPAVRAEAVNAIAQIVGGETRRARTASDSTAAERAVIAAVGILTGMIGHESDLDVRGVILRSAARFPYRTASAAVSGLSSVVTAAGAPTARPGVAQSYFARAYSLDALLRRNPALRTDATVIAAVSALDGASSAQGDSGPRAWTREARVLRASARGRILSIAQPDPNAIASIQRGFVRDFADPDAQVRRQTIALIPTATALGDSVRTRLVDAALRDPSFHVRVEAVRAYARRPNASCPPLVAATRDANPHVALTAIDAIPSVAECRDASTSANRLAELARSIPAREPSRVAGRGSWHAGAHAIVSLARLAPEKARPILGTLVTHPTWQVRMYAATAAGALGDTAGLARLAADQADNVRDAAINSLLTLVQPSAANVAPRVNRTAWADSIFTAQLARRDYQLVLNAARALERAAPSPRVRDALFASLERITAERSETSRDPRMEILDRIESAAGADQSSRLRPYLSDFDSAVAERAAAILTTWGVSGVVASPRAAPPLPVSLRELAVLRDARVRITMQPRSGGGSFELRLFPDEAPATIARFVSLARRGYYNGLTFHRMATNFVIQGGSPGANEYVGHDRFMRDELGLRSHARGTLGISTRGRDTGDAQIFVNLVDNFRLDHDYTVFAEVVRGLDVVDGILEGDVIARVEVVTGRR